MISLRHSIGLQWRLLFFLFILHTNAFSKEVAVNLIDSAKVLRSNGQLEESVVIIQKAIHQYTSESDSNKLFDAYWIQMILLKQLGEFEQSLLHAKKLRSFALTLQDSSFLLFSKVEIQRALLNIAVKKYQTAADILEDLTGKEQFNTKSRLGLIALISLSNCNSFLNKDEEQISYLIKAEKIAIEIGEDSFLPAIWDEIGFEYLYKKKENSQEAIRYVERSYKQELGSNLRGLVHTSDHLSVLYASVKNYKKAYEYSLYNKLYYDSLQVKLNRKKIRELNFGFNVKKDKAELRLKNLLIEQQKQQIENEKKIIFALISLLVLVFSFIVWITILYLKRKKALLTIQKLNNEIELMNDQLKGKIREKTKSLQEHIEKLEKYSYLNSHMVREPLTKILGFTKLIENTKEYKLFLPLRESALELDKVVSQINQTLNTKESSQITLYNFESITEILLIDDDRLQNMLSEKVLLSYNDDFNIVKFTKPQEAIEVILQKAVQPDLIFLDINMPIVNGWEFLEILQKNNIEIPIIMLTSSIDPADKIKASSFKMVKIFLSKPLMLEKVKSIFQKEVE